MRLSVDPRLPAQTDRDLEHMRRQLTDQLRQHAVQVNLLTEGSLSAVHNAMTAPPTAGTWAKGDFIRNSAPSELGTGGSKYVVAGWICTVSGTPGTWLQCRYLTGN
jgi:hypothetical protein